MDDGSEGRVSVAARVAVTVAVNVAGGVSVNVVVAVLVVVGVGESVGVVEGEFVAEGIEVGDVVFVVVVANESTVASCARTPGKCAPTGGTSGSTANGLLPGVPSSTGIISGSMGPKSEIGVGIGIALTRILAVTMPENPTFSTAC
jgi:hypothetical protein